VLGELKAIDGHGTNFKTNEAWGSGREVTHLWHHGEEKTHRFGYRLGYPPYKYGYISTEKIGNLELDLYFQV